MIRQATAVAATLVAIGMAVAACAGSGPSAPPSTARTSAAPATQAPATQAPAVPTAAPASAGTLSNGWAAATTEDGAIAYGLPPDWEQGSVAAMRDGIAADIDSGQLTGEYLAGSTWFLKLLDSGAVRGVISGPSPVEGYTVSVLFTVVGAPASLRSGAEAVIRDAPHPAGQRLSALVPVTLPIGEALIATLTSDSTGGSPSRGVLYFTLLRDGRLLWIDGAAPLEVDAFDGFMARVAATVSEA